MAARLKLSPHHHTGKYLPHHHTSYGGLMFILLLVGVILVGVTAVARADDFVIPPPVSKTVTVQAVVPGPIPAKGPTISSPANGQHFTTLPINISGTCVAGYLVNVYKNAVLAGAAICDRTGHFLLSADLFIGQNELVANMVNSANQPSPDSNIVTAYFDLLSSPANLIDGTTPGKHGNVIIKAQSVYKGTVPGQPLSWPIEVLGGVPPYALSIDWGDGTNDLISRAQPGQFTITHTYKKAGGYKGGYVMAIRAVDAEGTIGFMQLVAVVNNDVATAVSGGTAPGTGQWWSLLVAWPLWIIVLLLSISFWLGERRGRSVTLNEVPI